MKELDLGTLPGLVLTKVVSLIGSVADELSKPCSVRNTLCVTIR
jgi:hypothetical protein